MNVDDLYLIWYYHWVADMATFPTDGGGCGLRRLSIRRAE
jgi:hypothetical protein